MAKRGRKSTITLTVSQLAKKVWSDMGKSLKEGYCLHHKNNDSLDDRFENLMLISRSEHPHLHNKYNTKNKQVPRDWKKDKFNEVK